MSRIKNFFLLMLLGSIVFPGILMAEGLDLSGWWRASEVGELELKQSGNKVIAKQKDPDIVAALGENMFVGELSGNVIKGKIATLLPTEDRTLCGKNWANWVDFELTVSLDGNRLEGKWLQGHHTITEKDCPISSSRWEPFTLSRSVAPLEDGPMRKDYMMGILSLLGLSALFFFIRNAYVNYLVGSLKRSPNNAGFAGWGLFGGLLFGSSIGSAALISGSYLTPTILVSLGTLSVISFLACVLASQKK